MKTRVRYNNPELAALLARRKVKLKDLGAMLQGGASRAHLNLTLNGTRPVPGPNDGATRPLTRTWRQLRLVLSEEEFRCALEFANARRRESELALLVPEAVQAGTATANSCASQLNP